MKLSNKPLPVLVAICIFAFLVSVANANTELITLESGKEITRTIDLAAEDRVTIKIVVEGPAPSTVHFTLSFPNGTVNDYGDVSNLPVAFSTDVKGVCQMKFENDESSGSQIIVLNYEVEHYLFGFPQMIFLLVAITVLLCFVAAGYLIMGKYG